MVNRSSEATPQMPSGLAEKIGMFFLYAMAFFIPFSIAGEESAYVLMALVWLFVWVKNRKIPTYKSDLEIPLLALVLVLIAASIFSIHPGESFYNLRKLLFIPIIYILPAFIGTKRKLWHVVHLLLLMAVLTALYGIVKYAVTSWAKVIATQSTTMTWGALSMFFVLFWVGLLVMIPQRRWRIVYALGVIPQLVAQVFSYVRGSYLGLLTGLIVLGWVRSRKLILYFFIFLVGIYFLFPGSIQHRVRSITDLKVHSTQVRLTQWRDAVNMLRDHPVLGFGWVDLGDIHRKYAPPGADLTDGAYTIGHFHNNLVMMAMIAGVPGLAVFLWLFVEILVVLYKNYARIPEGREFLKSVALLGFIGVSGFLVNGLFDWLFGDEEVFILLFFTIGLALSAYRIHFSEKPVNSKIAGQ